MELRCFIFRKYILRNKQLLEEIKIWPEIVVKAVSIQDDGHGIRYIANNLGVPRSTISDAIVREDVEQQMYLKSGS